MLESRTFGKTGLLVSEIGLQLSGAADAVADLSRRAAASGCRLIHVDDPALLPAVRRDGVVVSMPVEGADLVLRPLRSPAGGSSRRSVASCAGPDDLAAALTRNDLWGISIPFSFAEQSCVEHLPKARRANLGVIGVDPLPGLRTAAGSAERELIGSLVRALAPLVKPHRTFFQAALQFALANQHIDCVLVAVSSASQLEEAMAAPEADPLSMSELEKIFETYAHRYDDDPSIGCGGMR